jgi:hypothetical protein
MPSRRGGIDDGVGFDACVIQASLDVAGRSIYDKALLHLIISREPVVMRKNRISTCFSVISGPGRCRSLGMSASTIALDIGALSHDNRH